MSVSSIAVAIDDPINARILAVSEDKIAGFIKDPFGQIASQSGIDIETVMERITAMIRAGTIRRMRQTLMATNLAQGALVAWSVPPEKLQPGFDYLFQNDPFSGHVVLRSTDGPVKGSHFRLWTTLKTPQGYSLQKHCEILAKKIGAEQFKIMPAKRLFALGVGHVRRRGMEPGSKSEALAEVLNTQIVQLNDAQWNVLMALKREFSPDEITREIWHARADEAGVSLETFYTIAGQLSALGVIGRFSTFLEHVKPLSDGSRVTKFNALFHWAVPQGREIETGRQVGRFHIMTHAYWREGGPDFNNVNIMGVAHGTDKSVVLQHKAAIDAYLKEIDIPVSYTNVFWGGRSEIKPSEIAPGEYRKWCAANGIDEMAMRE